MTNFLGIVDLWAYVVGTVIVVLMPGPNSLYVLSVSARRGVAAGYRGAFGVLIGDTVLMLTAILGMSALLEAYPVLFVALKYAGGAYLAYLGAAMVLSAWRSLRAPVTPESKAASPVPVDNHDPLRRALLISLLNPKGILFWMAFFIQFVDPTYAHKALSFAILGTIAQTCSFAYLSALILSGARLAAMVRGRRRVAAGLTGGAGTLFIGFGAKLASAGLG